MSAIQSTGKVANPKLTLYAFHLRNSLSQSLQLTVKNSEDIWETCQKVGEILSVPRLETLKKRLEKQWKNPIGLPLDNPNSYYLELLPQEQFLHFSTTSNRSSQQLRGEVYPLQIHDTYFVDITLRYPHSDVKVSQLNTLNPNGCLLPQNIQASLGQAWMLFAQPVGKIDNPQSFSNDCLRAILPESEVKDFLLSPPAKGKLLGSPIFVYENNKDDLPKQSYILIWLNCHSQTAKMEEEINYYHPLINLLCSRSKIIYAYTESRFCNIKAREIYAQIERYINAFGHITQSYNRHQEFKDLLIELPKISLQYNRYLRDLEDYKNTIKVNLKNYKVWLEKLTLLPSCELPFLQDFLDLSENKYLKQIEANQGYLTPGQVLSQQLLETIRGLAELEQTESDRRLERTIQVLGIGLTTGAIVGDGHSYTKKPFKPPFSTGIIHPFVTYLLWSFIAAFIAGLVTYLLTHHNLWLWLSNRLRFKNFGKRE